MLTVLPTPLSALAKTVRRSIKRCFAWNSIEYWTQSRASIDGDVLLPVENVFHHASCNRAVVFRITASLCHSRRWKSMKCGVGSLMGCPRIVAHFSYRFIRHVSRLHSFPRSSSFHEWLLIELCTGGERFCVKKIGNVGYSWSAKCRYSIFMMNKYRLTTCLFVSMSSYYFARYFIWRGLFSLLIFDISFRFVARVPLL